MASPLTDNPVRILLTLQAGLFWGKELYFGGALAIRWESGPIPPPEYVYANLHYETRKQGAIRVWLVWWENSRTLAPLPFVYDLFREVVGHGEESLFDEATHWEARTLKPFAGLYEMVVTLYVS